LHVSLGGLVANPAVSRLDVFNHDDRFI
jgi:hypothetical protein